MRKKKLRERWKRRIVSMKMHNNDMNANIYRDS